MSAPDPAAMRAASAEASSLSIPGNLTARNLLREEPERTGYPSEKYELLSSIAVFWSGSLPNPMPGSITSLSARIPASRAAPVRSLRNARISSMKPGPMAAGIVPGSPFMCMTTACTPVEAHSSSMPASLRPLTSLTISAPRETHLAATDVFIVSTDTGTSIEGISALRTGSSLEISSSAGTGAAFGRVDSPPTSMMSAPWSIISNAWRTAASGSVQEPPSEKESGVTFRIPMTRGGPPGALLRVWIKIASARR